MVFARRLERISPTQVAALDAYASRIGRAAWDWRRDGDEPERLFHPALRNVFLCGFREILLKDPSVTHAANVGALSPALGIEPVGVSASTEWVRTLSRVQAVGVTSHCLGTCSTRMVDQGRPPVDALAEAVADRQRSGR